MLPVCWVLWLKLSWVIEFREVFSIWIKKCLRLFQFYKINHIFRSVRPKRLNGAVVSPAFTSSSRMSSGSKYPLAHQMIRQLWSDVKRYILLTQSILTLFFLHLRDLRPWQRFVKVRILFWGWRGLPGLDNDDQTCSGKRHWLLRVPGHHRRGRNPITSGKRYFIWMDIMDGQSRQPIGYALIQCFL